MVATKSQDNTMLILMVNVVLSWWFCCKQLVMVCSSWRDMGYPANTVLGPSSLKGHAVFQFPVFCFAFFFTLGNEIVTKSNITWLEVSWNVVASSRQRQSKNVRSTTPGMLSPLLVSVSLRNFRIRWSVTASQLRISNVSRFFMVVTWARHSSLKSKQLETLRCRKFTSRVR